MDVDLYMSRLVNGQWTEPSYLPVNDSLAWDGSPAFSRDGKTLYFASNRAGGAGGIDPLPHQHGRLGAFQQAP